MILLAHFAPILYCSSVNDALFLIGISTIIQVVTELPWMLPLWSHNLYSSTLFQGGLCAVIFVVAGYSAWVASYSLVIVSLICGWGAIANYTQGSSTEKMIGYVSGWKGATVIKLDEIESKTKQLEFSLSRLEESQKIYIEWIVGRGELDSMPRREPTLRERVDKVYVKPFPFHLKELKLSPQASPKMQSFEIPIQGREVPEEGIVVSPRKSKFGTSPKKLNSPFLPTISEYGEAKIDTPYPKVVQSPMDLCLITDPSPLAVLSPISLFDSVGSTNLFHPIPIVTNNTSLESILADPPEENPGYFSLHGLPFTSSIKNLLTRQLFHETVPAEVKHIYSHMENPNPDIRLRYHEYPKVLSNTKKAKKQKELELKRDLSTTIERLIFEPSLTEMKKIVKCLQMILTSKFDYYFAPYLTADMLLTWNIIFQYLIWENIFANFKIYHIFFTLPVFILKMMIFKIPLKMIKFQYEIYFFILNSAYKRIFNLGKKESNLNHQPFSL